MKYLLLTFDIEEFIGKEFGITGKDNLFFNIGKRGFENILCLLNRNGIKATFFTTLQFAEFCPALIKQSINDGHEIGLHAYSHNHRYKQMPRQKAYDYIKTAKQKLEKKFKIKILGFRAPQMSHPPYELLKEIGFSYDSSFHPTFVPGHYNLFFGTRHVHNIKGLTILPVSVTPVIKIPFSWIWFRNMPLIYSELCTKFSLINENYINIYFHPWEFIDVSLYSDKINPLILRKTGDQLILKLDKYTKWCKKRMISSTIMDYLKNESKAVF